MPEPNIAVQEYRVSYIWFDVDIGLLRSDGFSQPHSVLFGNKIRYRDFLQGLLAQPPFQCNPRGMALPWTNYTRDRFWHTYLSQETSCNSRLLSRQLVPAYVKIPTSLDDVQEPRYIVSHQAFAYPFGQVVAMHVQVSGPTSLHDLVNEVHRLLGLRVAQSNAKISPVSLGAAGNALLHQTRRAVVGPSAALSQWQTIEPLSVVTITAASGSDANMQPDNNDALHRSVWALTRRDHNWEVVTLKSISDCNRKTRALSSKCLIFQNDHGNQAIWCPDMFEPDGSSSKSLICYHHNLVANTIQFGSLIRFLDACGGVLKRDEVGRYTEMLSFCAARATDILRRARNPWDDTTYHSGSTAALIDANPDLIQRIALVRKYFGRDAFEV